MELAYLGVDAQIFQLRQNQLSCTVENKSKLDELEEFYTSIGQHHRYQHVTTVVRSNAALAEVNRALYARNERGEINNTGVLAMIDQYFTELAFVYAELFRVCRPGAHVAFVNDNVRYAGEIIPVDLLSTDLAEQLGYEPVKVYVLPQRKGNSSQQMGRFGREALRKSITVWRKPETKGGVVMVEWKKKRNQVQGRSVGFLRDEETNQPVDDESDFDPILSTPEEIKRAVECNAVDRGVLFIGILAEFNIDGLLDQVEELAKAADKEDISELATTIGIDRRKLQLLDNANPPIPYLRFFCTPDILVRYPELTFYYRNVAMLSDKVMRDIGLHTAGYERGALMGAAQGMEIARYLNQIISGLLMSTGVSRLRHLEMLLANLGDAIGGSSRNEVGRVAMAQVMRPLIEALFQRGYLESISYSTRSSLMPCRLGRQHRRFGHA